MADLALLVIWKLFLHFFNSCFSSKCNLVIMRDSLFLVASSAIVSSHFFAFAQYFDPFFYHFLRRLAARAASHGFRLWANRPPDFAS